MKPGPGHPWDQAHRAVRDPRAAGFEATARPPDYAEPDFVQAFPFPRADSGGLESSGRGPREARGPAEFWPVAEPRHGWLLDDAHSQLKAAHDRVGDTPPARAVRIAHLDSGYDPGRPTRQDRLGPDLDRNYVDGDPTDATDPGRYALGKQRGHGTATVALLAGNQVSVPATGFNDRLG